MATLFGLEIRRKAAPVASSVSPVPSGRAWWPIIRDWFAGAWQRNQEWSAETVLAHHAVYACVTLIANDIGKLRPKLVEQDTDGIWKEARSSAFSPVLKKPNRYQNRIQFIEWWIASKLYRGNTYVLKVRDERKVVRALHVLDPNRVTVLVTTEGDVYYQLNAHDLNGIRQDVTVPASEIIHDRMNCLFHPLVGCSPIYASGMAANIGLKIQQNSAGFFGNGSNPSGILSTPVTISPDKAKALSELWNAQFSGDRSGGVAVLGDGMKFEPMRMTAVDSQLIEQLKWTAEVVCSTFHVPPFKVAVGTQPTYANAEIANQIYYSDCLQSLIEQFELCMDEGLGLDEPKDGKTLGVELDLEALLRMDTASQVKTMAEAVKGSIMVPNEARARLNLPPKKGGDQIWMQQQNFSLEALAKRDEKEDPFGTTPTPAPASPAPPSDDEPEERGVAFWLTRAAEIRKSAA